MFRPLCNVRSLTGKSGPLMKPLNHEAIFTSCRFRFRDNRQLSSIPPFISRIILTEILSPQYAPLGSGILNEVILARHHPNTSQCTRPSGKTFDLVFDHRYAGGQAEDRFVEPARAESWTGRWGTMSTMV